jgi:hypothetical protein
VARDTTFSKQAARGEPARGEHSEARKVHSGALFCLKVLLRTKKTFIHHHHKIRLDAN